HNGLRNEMEGFIKTYNTVAELMLQHSALAFNHGVEEVFIGVVNGGTIYVVPYIQCGDPIPMTKIVHQELTTYTKVTPSESPTWIELRAASGDQACTWRSAFAGGGPLTNHALQQLAGLGLDKLGLYNTYGPSKISISSQTQI
ncbi:hypothetical protein COCVIDRAFT_43691, partial [Bipolaris victoriae FI3]